MEPPPSVARAAAPIPVETAAAAPPLDDPVVSSGRHGFRVVPKSGVLTIPRPLENSDTFVLPRITAPASRRRATGASSRSGTKSRKTRVPHEQGRRLTVMLSLMVKTMPSRGPRSVPLIHRSRLSRAAARAPGLSRCAKALTRGLTCSTRSRIASKTSVGLVWFDRKAAWASRTPSCHSGTAFRMFNPPGSIKARKMGEARCSRQVLSTQRGSAAAGGGWRELVVGHAALQPTARKAALGGRIRGV